MKVMSLSLAHPGGIVLDPVKRATGRRELEAP